MVGEQGEVWQFLGFTRDDGVIVTVAGLVFLDRNGNRVDPADVDPANCVAFTAALRDADQQPAVLAGLRPRCPRCRTPLAACEVCGGPAMCGEPWCTACQPD